VSLTRATLLGPPGAGKGTQAKRVVAQTGLVHLSTGDILRDEVSRGTNLGEEAKSFMDRGELVPDPLVIDMIRGRIEATEKGFLLDGFPRTVPQAEALEGFVTLEVAINVDLSRERALERLTSRRVCRSCGRIYNLHFNAPLSPSRCEACGGELYQREDDQPAVIENRYDVYTKLTAPLIDYFRKRKLLRNVDGAQPSDAVFEQILAILAG
jgi:adenylate kinase